MTIQAQAEHFSLRLLQAKSQVSDAQEALRVIEVLQATQQENEQLKKENEKLRKDLDALADKVENG